MDSPRKPTTSSWGRLLQGLPRRWRPYKQGKQCVEDSPGEEPSFEEHLERGRLSRAAEQLLAREERLFGERPEERVGGEERLFGERPEERVGGEERLFGERPEERGGLIARLAEDRAAFASRLRQALSRSFNSGAEDVEVLRSAVDAIRKDEEQDRRWPQGGRSAPEWRPGGWRELHDAALRDLVEERMDGASTPGDSAGQSSVQREIRGCGRQLSEDLGLVVRVVKDCYPADMDICNLYGRLYHRAFSARLRKLAEFGLDDADVRVILRWVNGYYPELLKTLGGQVSYEELGPLLPQDLYSPLEAQFLSTTQEEVQTCLKRFLKEEEEVWKGGAPTDGSPLAIDVLQCVNGAVQATDCILGDQRKAQVVVCLLSEFLDSLRSFLSNVMRSTARNSRPLLLAHLPGLHQFREYIVQKEDLFPAEVKERCLLTLSCVKESTHTSLLSPIHTALKPHYRTVGTSMWLKKPLFEDLLNSLELHLQDLQGLSDPTREELVGRLQVEVTVEYVRRLLKGNLRLKEAQRQEQAAQTVTDDAQRLSNMFSGAGSRQCWLDGIMSQIAEVLKLQDLPSIQIVVASMGMIYPDLSSKHVSCLLKMKSVSWTDRMKVRCALDDCRKQRLPPDPTPPPPFFSRLHLT